MALISVPVATFRPERFADVLDPGPFAAFMDAVERGREVLHGRIVWNVNSTAHGGGVAEMLQSLLAYSRGAGVDARWMVIEGSPPFFAVTKRIHNRLHGFAGDGGPLRAEETAIYEETAAANAADLVPLVRSQDIVLVHDPQTAGLCAPLRETGATVIWRCHVGVDAPNDLARSAWSFLLPHVEPAHAYVFSRAAFGWEGLDRARIFVIPPSIDAFAPKNQDLSPATTLAILAAAGLVDARIDAPPSFVREDGSPGTVVRTAAIHGDQAPPSAVARTVTQVSRWDRLKDPVGVIRGFAEHVGPFTDADLVVAGPSTAAVADDPEGAEVLQECQRAVAGLPSDLRARVHLVSLPMEDREENAAIVNALQRRADVVVQKSLAEGFGLTVAEAMWKARPVVASRIGGIQDQIADGETGLLIDDPNDLAAFGRSLLGLLANPDRAEEMGQRARRRVRDGFLGARHLMQYLDLFTPFLDGP
jgi:trehalose synthase